MISSIVKIYRNYIGSRLFIKNMLTFSFISIIPIILLSLYISNDIAKTLQEKEIVQINLVTYNLNSYLDKKYDTFYNLVKQAYADKIVSPEFFDFIESNAESSSKAYYEYKSIFVNYFNGFFNYDPDVKNVLLYRSSDATTSIISKDFGDTFYRYDVNDSKFEEHLKLAKPTLIIDPSRYPTYSKDERIYSFSINLKYLGTNINSSILQLDYSPDGFKQAIQQMSDDQFLGTFYIITPSGEILYDSSGQYYGTIYPYFEVLKDGISSGIIDGQESILSFSHQNKLGLIVAQVIPKDMIFKDIDAVRLKIFLITFLCILFVILLTQLSTSIFSKRISAITSAMKMVRVGNFGAKITTKPYGDEINDIAINFNEMCTDLTEYINKVYVYELYKKNAELEALQTQINPHFIYNTLEAIRMSATSHGDSNVSQMIYLLAKLFRNIVKEENVVSIEHEISNAKLYLDLFKIRFGSNFSYQFTIDPQINSLWIPKHILQPLIENYVIHGYDIKNNHNHIHISCELVAEDILITIVDNGLGIDAEHLEQINEHLQSTEPISRTHIGLKNVNERIKLIYGLNYGVSINSKPFQGTTVTLRISALSKKGKEVFGDV
jgi:two-component system, sensor histidine kinase YesM